LSLGGAVSLSRSARAGLLSCFLASALCAQEKPDPGEKPAVLYEDCKSCRATGSLSCPGCRGEKKRQGLCPSCRGAGGKPCDSPRCRRSPAGRDAGCPLCAGSGFRTCAECQGKKLALIDCARCQTDGQSTGRIDCSKCAGGRIEIPAPPPPKVPSSKLAELREAFRACLEDLELLAARLERLGPKLEKLSERRSRIEEELKALGDPLSLPLTARAAATALQGDWASLDAGWEAAQAAVAEALRAGEEAAPRRKKLAGAPAGLARLELSRLVATEAELGDQQKFRDDLKKRINGVDGEIGRLGESIEKQEEALSRLKRAISRDVKRRASETKRGEATRLAYASFERALSALPSKALLPPLRAALVAEMSPGPTELCVELSYLDDEAADSPDLADVRPSEKYLRALPPLVEDVFRFAREVKQVRLSVQANHRGEGGRVAAAEIQRFTMWNSPEWQALMAGESRDDWKQVLHSASPRPPLFPEEERSGLETLAFILLAAGSLVLGVAVLILVWFYARR